MKRRLFNFAMLVLSLCTGGLSLCLAAPGLFVSFVWSVADIVLVTRDGRGRVMQ